MDALLLTVRQTAAALAVSRSRVYELIKSGELPAVHAGGSRTLRVRRDDLQLYVTSLPADGADGAAVA